LDPYGNTVASSERVFEADGKFVATVAGRYRLVFDNLFSYLASKTVRLDYQIIPPE
jgi:hypothetical protein